MLLAAVGCNQGRQMQADLYRRELRLQEDEIYRLEDYLREYQGLVRGYRREVGELKQQLATAQGQEVVPAEASPDAETPGLEFAPGAPPLREATTPTPVDEPGESPATPSGEELDEAPPFNAGVRFQHPSRTDPAPRPLARLDRVSRVSDLSVAPTPFPTTSPQAVPAAIPAQALLKLDEVDAVRLAVRNGEADANGTPTLIAEVTPLAAGLPAYFEGEASVMLADMSRRGANRRLMRWDFTADEVEACWTKSDGSSRLELPLLAPRPATADAPTDRALRLWVRLVDARGRKTLRSVEARFANRPFRLLESEAIAAAPRRLPSPRPGDAPVELSDLASSWRRAVPGRKDRAAKDAAVTPAAFLGTGGSEAP